MSALLKPCAGCGDLAATAWCETCKPPKREPYPKRPRQLGYDTAWDKLSKRARKLQPWCTDCGATDDLTCDHSEQAWQRKADGLPIRLDDVDVVCRSCNGKRGRARPTTASTPTTPGGTLDAQPPGTAPLAQVPLSEDPSDRLPAPSGRSHGSTAPVKGPRSGARAVRVLGSGAGS